MMESSAWVGRKLPLMGWNRLSILWSIKACWISRYSGFILPKNRRLVKLPARWRWAELIEANSQETSHTLQLLEKVKDVKFNFHEFSRLSGYWQINIDGALLNGNSIAGTGSAISDTGTSLIIGPQAAINAIVNTMNGVYDPNQGLVGNYPVYHNYAIFHLKISSTASIVITYIRCRMWYLSSMESSSLLLPRVILWR